MQDIYSIDLLQSNPSIVSLFVKKMLLKNANDTLIVSLDAVILFKIRPRDSHLSLHANSELPINDSVARKSLSVL